MRLLTLALLLGLTACSPDGASNAAPQAPPASKAEAASDASAPPAPVRDEPVEPQPQPVDSEPGTSVPLPGEPVEPQPQPVGSEPGVPSKAGEPVEPQPRPEPARRVAEELLTKDEVYYGCNTPADCEVKNVGNCCGYYPACVNKDSPTFPDKVKAACAAEGINSVCGFPEISSCDCIEGRCAPIAGPGGGDVR